jgi:hypothetical protein
LAEYRALVAGALGAAFVATEPNIEIPKINETINFVLIENTPVLNYQK